MNPSERTDFRVFLIAAVVCGLIYSIAIPPFAAPDEGSHFYRAWWVSEGHLGALRDGHKVGFMLPVDIITLPEQYRLKPTIDRALIGKGLKAPATREAEAFVHDPDHAVASVVPYIPQGVGIAVGRATGASPLLCAYLGRFANLLAGIVLIALAIRFLPSYRWLLIVIALTPMSNYLRISLSGDVVTIGLAYLFIALVARALFIDEALVSTRLWAAITITGGLLCLTKVTYIPLAMLPLIVRNSRFRSAAAAWRARVIHAGVAILAALAASRIASYYWEPFRDDVTAPREQFAYIFGHPLAFARVLFGEYVIRAKWYIISMIGDLGSGQSVVALPKLLIVFYLAGMLALVLFDTNPRLRITLWQRIYFALMCAGAAFAVALAIYTTWNVVGADHIDGLQGRYYLPFLPAAAFIFHRSANGLSQRWRMLIALGVVAIANAIALHLVVAKWYA